jgi:hypothetical protein
LTCKFRPSAEQAAAIEQATHLKVKTFVGSDGVDYWKRERWIEQIKACDVGVMTPQVFLNLCDNAYWSFDQVSPSTPTRNHELWS